MNKWLELLVGLILVIVPIVLAFYYVSIIWQPAWIVLKGGIFWGVIMIGLLFIMLGISDLKG